MSEKSSKYQCALLKLPISYTTALFSGDEIREMHRLKLSRIAQYVYFVVKLESQEQYWLHTTRSCRDWNLWRSSYIHHLEMLAEYRSIASEKKVDRNNYHRQYHIEFLLAGGDDAKTAS